MNKYSITALLLVLCFHSGITLSAQNLYALSDIKSFGVASDDNQALMYLGTDKDFNVKGICFLMVKQARSIIPLTEITATVDGKVYPLHGLRPKNSKEGTELVCTLGSEAIDYLAAIVKSSRSNVSFDFNGEVRKFTFDTAMFGKVISGDRVVLNQILSDYKKGVRAPVMYNQSGPINIKNNEDVLSNDTNEAKFQKSDQYLNEIWTSLSDDTKKRLLPTQRKWIKYKDLTCKGDVVCQTEMTNKRIEDISKEK